MKRTLLLLALLLPAALSAQPDGVRQLAKLTQFYRYLTALYVDSLQTAPLVERAIEGMLSELDPHSAYLDADEMQAVAESFGGSFSGVGIEYTVYDDTLRVVGTVAGGPSERVGLHGGDRIVTVDGRSIVPIRRKEVPALLRGEKGTEVAVGVVRPGEAEPLRFRIVRDDIPLRTVDAAYRLDDTTGYVRINRFGRTTMREVDEAMASMPGLRALVLDLRGNGGGLMDEAIDLAAYFLPGGRLITSTEGRAVEPHGYRSTADGPFMQGAVALLLDEESASGSELAAGALQDWDRALLLGRPTFGKGLVQRQLPLPDGSAVRITVARYHTPTGRVIQRPFEPGKSDAYYADFERRLREGEGDDTTGRPRYRTLRLGRTVYGGGGIRPDILLERDTSGFTPFLHRVVAHGLPAEAVERLLDRERSALRVRYPDFERYAADDSLAEPLLAELFALARERGIEPTAGESERSHLLLARMLRALLAGRLWDTQAFYRMANEEDPWITRAREALRSNALTVR